MFPSVVCKFLLKKTDHKILEGIVHGDFFGMAWHGFELQLPQK